MTKATVRGKSHDGFTEPRWAVDGEWPDALSIDDEAFARAIAEGRRHEAA